MKRNAYNSAFTLVEFAIIVVISGLLLTAVVKAYITYTATTKYHQGLDQITRIDTSIANYRNAKGANPCPSDPSLPITDPNAGTSVTAVDSNGVTQCWAIVQFNKIAPNCNSAGQPFSNSKAGSMCLETGARDTLADSDPNPDLIITGGVPFVTIKAGIDVRTFTSGCPSSAGCTGTNINPSATMDCFTIGTVTPQYCDVNSDGVIDNNLYMPGITATFSDVAMSDALDPWQYQYSYVVSQTATVPATYGSGQYGTIDVQTEQLVPLLQPAGIANYVIISHGDNHNGAYSATGTVPVPCGPIPPATGGTADNYNCNNGNIYISGLRTMGNNASYFDDIVKYQSATITKLWDVDSTGKNLYNLNLGNVGVGTGTAAPAERLEVTGDIDVNANFSTSSNNICNADGTHCWSPVLMGGYDQQDLTNAHNPSPITSSNLPSSNQCALNTAGQVNVATGVVDGQIQCTCPASNPNCAAAISPPALILGQQCPAGQYVNGFNSAGIICITP